VVIIMDLESGAYHIIWRLEFRDTKRAFLGKEFDGIAIVRAVKLRLLNDASKYMVP
jgi:hypothetical protein